jgi:TetR/AcrR family transcriptional regulator, cholesterol catabolism regulator
MKTNKPIRTYSKNSELVDKRRKQIIDGAIKAFIRLGFDNTSMSNIAGECGMSKGLLYHYIKTKDDVLYLVAKDQYEVNKTTYGEERDRCAMLPPLEALLHFINFYYHGVDGRQNYNIFLNQVVARLPKEDRKVLFAAERNALSILEDIIRRGIASGEFITGDPVLMAHNIFLIGRVWADRRWFLGKLYSIDDYIRVQTDAILKMLQDKQMTQLNN